MRVYDSYTSLVTAERESRANYFTLVSCILPRPIAFVSTISADGVRNLAPFSFFSGACANPPAVVFAPATDRAGKDKDTLNNLRTQGECVVNVVPYEIREAMNQASYAYPPEVDEFVEAGFTPLASELVRPPRVGESPVQMECRLIQIVKVGQGPVSGNLCICEVLCFHVAEEMCLPDGTVDVARIDLIGRLGGAGYSTIRDRFELPRPAPRAT
ncbi:MAG TPA: flavin reductase family protein [Phycisphaerae bacterium]|nr:flavin reductase family protein [Phycisphaerae bacterium]